MPEFSVTEAASLDAVQPAEWDSLVRGGGFYQSHAWLRAQEGEPGVTTSYLLATRNGRLLGALPLYSSARDHRAAHSTMFQRDCRLLLAGIRSGYHNGLLLHPELLPESALGIWETLVGRALGFASDRGCSGILLDYLTAADAPLLAGRAIFAYREPEAMITVPGSGGYVASLPPSARQVVRREMRRFQDAGWHVGTERLSACLDEVGPLLAATERKYGSDLSAEQVRAFLDRQVPYLDDLSAVHTCRDANGRLAAFSLIFTWRATAYARVVGFDYDRLRQAFEYFNLLFYRPLSGPDAPRRLHLGVDSLPAKARRGARLRPLWAAAIFATGPDGGCIGRAEALSFAAMAEAEWSGAITMTDWSCPAST